MPKKTARPGVRGPNSALTEFLRNEGITNAFRQRRERENRLLEAPELAQSSATISPDVTASPAVADDDEEEQIRAAGRKKRRLARGGPGGGPDSSDSDSDFHASDNDAASDDELANGYKKFGSEDTCVECGSAFTLTVYLRYLDDSKGYLCEACNEELKQKERTARRNQLNARKRRKKLAQALLDRQTVRLASLQDVCIRTITSNIADVEALGDIGQANTNKILKILLKNRSLNDSTVSLFLNPQLRHLEFWDCSNVSSHSFNQIAAYCSQLQLLTLFMCGQFHNDNLHYYKDKLPHLKALLLNGPFLISNALWQEFFDEAQCPLEAFEVRNTHRFGNDSLIALLEKRGSALSLLKLSRLDGLDLAAVYELIPQYISSLTALELSHPYKEDLITDDLMIHILAITGESLKELNVDGCSALTDEFLTEGVAKFCPNLESLSMRNLDLVTDEGFADALTQFSEINNGGLVTVDLTKCTGLGNKAVAALLRHSGNTLVELSLNSLDNLTKDFLLQLMTDNNADWKLSLKQSIADGINDELEEEEKKVFYDKIGLPNLTKLDIGFVRQFDDEVLKKFSEECTKLAIVEVYGDSRCTSKAQFRSDLMVIGRQGDSV